MKHLFDSSLGPLELDLDVEHGIVSIWLFDADGHVAAESADEWEQADLSDLLHTEIGLPEQEAQSIDSDFVALAKTEGHDRGTPGRMGNVLGIVMFGSILAILGVGLWTILFWIV